MPVFRSAVVRGPASVCALSVVFAAARSALDLAYCWPVAQAHSDKWYPSFETWTLREGRLRKLWRTSGHQLLERTALANEVNGERFYCRRANRRSSSMTRRIFSKLGSTWTGSPKISTKPSSCFRKGPQGLTSTARHILPTGWS